MKTHTRHLRRATTIAFLLLLPACSDKGTTPLPAQTLLLQNTNTLPDFASFSDVKQKKQAFFSYLKPLVNAHNEHIYSLRQSVVGLMTNTQVNGNTLSSEQQAWIENLALAYKVPKALTTTEAHFWKELMDRVDIIPASLVLAQAANESAWGTSRFAKQGNNLFGQWCFSSGCGMVPSSRKPGATHEVAVFQSPEASVASYMKNINTNAAYETLRSERAKLWENRTPVTGLAMTKGLTKYSERGEAYISELQTMIRTNHLSDYDQHYPPIEAR